MTQAEGPSHSSQSEIKEAIKAAYTDLLIVPFEQLSPTLVERGVIFLFDARDISVSNLTTKDRMENLLFNHVIPKPLIWHDFLQSLVDKKFIDVARKLVSALASRCQSCSNIVGLNQAQVNTDSQRSDISLVGFPEAPRFYWSRPELEESVFKRICENRSSSTSGENFIQSQQGGLYSEWEEFLLIVGEGGVGKTSLTSVLLKKRQSVLANELNIDRIVWFPAMKYRKDTNYSADDFYSDFLGKLDKRKLDRHSPELKSILESTLLVIDDIFDAQVAELLAKIGVKKGSCLLLSRNEAEVDSLRPKIIQLDQWTCQELISMFKNFPWRRNLPPIEDNHSESLANLCCGLPLAADLLLGKFDSAATKHARDAIIKKMINSPLRDIAALTTKRGDKVDKTIAEILAISFESEDTALLEHFAAFLLFDEGTVVPIAELELIWNLTANDVRLRCDELFQRRLVRPIGDEGYTVHGLLYEAAHAKLNADQLKKRVLLCMAEMQCPLKATSGENILHVLIRLNQQRLVGFLVQKDALPVEKLVGLCSKRNEATGYTPLHYLYHKEIYQALKWSWDRLVQLISDLPSDIQKIKDHSGASIFDCFCREHPMYESRGNKRVLQGEAKNEGFKIEVRQDEVLLWREAIVDDAVHGRLDKIQQWLNNESNNVNSPIDSFGQTILHLTAQNGQFNTTKWLLERPDVNPNVISNNGSTALHYAADRGRESIVRLLLNVDGIDPNVRDKKGSTPLHDAAVGGNESIVRLLLDVGADPCVREKDGSTPLHCAAWGGNESIVKLLLNIDGVDPNLKDEKGQTPLHLVAFVGQKDAALHLLLSPKTNPNAKDNDGDTPLYNAVYAQNFEVVKLLLQIGEVNPKSKNTDGFTPWHLAVAGGYDEMVNLFKQSRPVRLLRD